jgi:transcriptional regulator with XRE-family HTH domain
MPDATDIGNALKEMRERTGLKPVDYAREMNIATSYIYQVEGNVQIPSEDYLLNLISIYRTRSDDDLEQKAGRIGSLVDIIKDKFLETNINRICRKAESKFGDLYKNAIEKKSENNVPKH